MKKSRYCSYVDPISHQSCGKKILWTFGQKNVCWQHNQLWQKIVSLSVAAGILLTIFTFLSLIISWVITFFAPFHYKFQPLFEQKQVIDQPFTVNFQLVNTGKKKIEQLQVTLVTNDHFQLVSGANRHLVGTIIPDEKVNLSRWRLHPNKQGSFDIEVLLEGKGVQPESLKYPIEVMSVYDIKTTESIQKKINQLEMELKQIDKKRFPLQFAQTSIELGDSYLNLPTIPRDKHLYQAIEHYSKAEIFFEKGGFNEKLAKLLLQKGLAYSSLQGGNSFKDIKISIECYKKALRYVSIESNPELYGKILTNLGNEYSHLSELEPKNKIQYVEIALQNYQKSKEALPKEKYPYLNTLVKMNIGVAHYRSGNIKKAIDFYEDSLNYFSKNKQKHPYQYAMLRSNLGEGYRRLPATSSEIRQKNLQNALDNLQEALKIYTIEHYPVEYSKTQFNLGSVYNELSVGDLRENQRRSEKAYLNALEVLTRENYPYYYANIQSNLGNTYVSISGYFHSKQNEFLSKAITCYNISIKTFNALNIPAYNTWNGLGEAYRIKVEGNRHKNLQKAIAAYDKAIQEFLMYNPNQKDSKVLEMYKKNRSMTQKELTLLDSN